MNRKTTPKVKNGRVQKKNRHDLTPNYWNTRQDSLQIDIESPGKGYKHFLKKRDIISFLEILPNWKEIDIELDAILLAEGGGPDGWYNDGVIGICAWDKNMTCSFDNKAIIIKDFVKSEKHNWNDACFIPNASDKKNVQEIVEHFFELRGSYLNEGIVFREFVELEFLTEHSKSGMPLTKEFRIVFLNKKVVQIFNYWDERNYDSEKPNLRFFPQNCRAN